MLEIILNIKLLTNIQHVDSRGTRTLEVSTVNAIMTASITGAGLVIAFYALLANMSEKVFANRHERINHYRQEIKKVSSNPKAFTEANLKETTEHLERLRKKTDLIKTFPKYLGIGIITNFVLFILAAYLSFICLTITTENQASMGMMQALIELFFVLSLVIFTINGIYGISDILLTLWANFDKLRQEKKELKTEIDSSPKEAEIMYKVVEFLDDNRVCYETHASLKTDDIVLYPDVIILSNDESVKYVIEVLARPTADNVYKISEKYEKDKEECHYKTILVADFENRSSLIEIAKAYWDFVLDFRELDKLSSIVRSAK